MTENNLDWKTTNTRFIIFLDVMGFKDFVARHTHDYVYESMEKLSKTRDTIDSIFNSKDGDYKSMVYSTSFSDSIILFSKDDSLDSLASITISSCYIMAEALKESIPVKGAMAHGQISVNKEKQIYFGQPLIDAYLLQEEVYYYGIVAHNSVDRHLSSLTTNEPIWDFFIELQTPLKTGSISHKNVNWFNLLKKQDEDITVITINFSVVISKLKLLTSGGPRKYIDNTLNVFEQIYKK